MRSHETPCTESDKHCDQNKANVWAGDTFVILKAKILVSSSVYRSRNKRNGRHYTLLLGWVQNIRQSKRKPREWKLYIDDIFYLWDSARQEISLFIEQANKFHPTIKFTAEFSEIETTFLDTVIYKGDRFRKVSILHIRTHYKPTETFQYRHFTHQA